MPVQVLHDIDFAVYQGEVTALVGDNGAGKSTLVKCFAGINHIDTGQIFWEGKPVTITSPHHASALGIEFVYQDLALADNLDITQNMFLGREIRTGPFLADGEMERQGTRDAHLARRYARSTRSASRSQASPVASGRQWRSPRPCCGTAGSSSSTSRPRPSASRRPARCSTSSAGLADNGIGVVLISHNMNDVMEVADRVDALYLGRIAAEVRKDETCTSQIVELITSGRSGDIGLSGGHAVQSA